MIVSLDKDSLEPSAECADEIDYLLQRNVAEKVPKFHAKFGMLLFLDSLDFPPLFFYRKIIQDLISATDMIDPHN